MNKIEPQAWKCGTDWQWPEGIGEGDNGGKKGKELNKEPVWMTHGHKQGLTVRVGIGMGIGGQRGGKLGQL